MLLSPARAEWLYQEQGFLPGCQPRTLPCWPAMGRGMSLQRLPSEADTSVGRNPERAENRRSFKPLP
jgi:hypothetical protein